MMLSDVRSAGSPAASPRPGIALLTLLLRSALKEAADAESAAEEIGRSAIREELRARLVPLMEQRRVDLDAEVALARADAAGVLSAAHREASAILAQAAPPIADVTAWLEDTWLEDTLEHDEGAAAMPPLPTQTEENLSADEARYTTAMAQRAGVALLALQLRGALREATDAEAAAEAADHAAALDSSEQHDLVQRRVDLDAALARASAEAAAVIAAAHREATALVAEASRTVPLAPAVPDEPMPTPAPPTEPTQITAVVDGEAFAKVFATVFATILDERLASGGGGLIVRPTYEPAPPPAALPVPVQQSFWAHARHLDVLLLGAAMVIVLVVLAAWLA